jgi:hypothetical protein
LTVLAIAELSPTLKSTMIKDVNVHLKILK